MLRNPERAVPSWVANVEGGERRIDVIEFAWWCLACGENPATAAPPLLAQARLRR